jgi:ribosomal protein L11 methyltransferase
VAGAHQQASLRVPREQAPLLESLLRSQGALAVSLTDVADTPILEPGVGETPLWAEVTVTGLFHAGIDRTPVDAAMALLTSESPTWEAVPDRAWERAWMDRFAPMRFGQCLWIVPTGMDCPEPDAVQLHLDPGLAFGTGTHPTTRLCLEWIDGAELAGRTVLDFGCGSGVLGIAAALLDAAPVRCVDYDEQAVTATRENALRNAVESSVTASRGDSPPALGADVVLANILAGVLIRLAKPLQEACRPGGTIVLSGILVEQADEVAAAFDRCPGMERRHHDGWVLLVGQRA